MWPHTYADGHGHTFRHTSTRTHRSVYICSQHMWTHTCAHTNSGIHGKTHTQSRLRALNTHACAHGTQAQAHTTHLYVYQTHIYHKHTLRHGAQPHTDLGRHTCPHRCTRGPMLTQARSCGRAQAHACPHTPAQLQGPIAWQGPHPHPFISPWTVASGLDWSQGVGAEQVEAAGWRCTRLGRGGGRMTLDA